MTDTKVDLALCQRLARATCTELHTNALASGHLVKARRDPAQYRARLVFPIVYAALATGLIKEVSA